MRPTGCSVGGWAENCEFRTNRIRPDFPTASTTLLERVKSGTIIGALLRRRQVLLPTWRGWLLIGFAVFWITFFAVRNVYAFLATADPLPGGVLVVEGWAADYALEAALAEFQSHHYDRIVVTGGPLEWGAPLSEYHSYAERGAAILVKWGLSTNVVQAVPSPRVRQDRTYTSARSLKAWCQDREIQLTRVHLMTEGPHARRSRLLYRKALGPGVVVGVTAIEVREYDPKHWWRYSAGVRGIIDESIAYLYARFLFHPHAD